ncbi:MAG: hypothetical protein AAB327_02160 [Actinomycetota bacterium]
MTDPDWAANTVGWIDRVIALIRRRTTQPLVVMARGLVFGILALVTSSVVLTLLIIGGFRALVSLGDVWLAHGTSVWLAYMVLGSLFILTGAVLMRQRRPRRN